jgi:hypothetical protein
LFVDSANHDYTVAAGSPALGLGFVNIDQDSIGLKADWPWNGDWPTPTPTPTPDHETPPGVTLLSISDALIASESPSRNYGRHAKLIIAPDNSSVGLIKFNLNPLPDDAYVVDAELQLYMFRFLGVEPQQLQIHQVKKLWKELETTWISRTTTRIWQEPGCKGPTDRETTAAAVIDVGATPWVWLKADLTDLVQAWVSGAETNHGIVLRGNEDQQNATLYICSREWGIETQAPRLVVYYTSADPTPTPTPTAAPTVLPELTVVIVGPTPVADMTVLTYTVGVTNPKHTNRRANLGFFVADGMTFAAATPPASRVMDDEQYAAWYNHLYRYGVTNYTIYLNGPDVSGAYTQTAVISAGTGFIPEMYDSDSHVITLTVTIATATPTSTPTRTPTPAVTNTPTPTPTVTPTWTPYPPSLSQVVINEVCPMPRLDHNHNGVANSEDEFLELLEVHGESADITGWSIVIGKPGRGKVYVIPSLTVIAANKRLVIYGHQYLYDDTPLETRRQFRLLNRDICVTLLDGSGNEMDSVCYSSLQTPGMIPIGRGQSWGRYPDGHAAHWQYLPPSPGYSNALPTATPTTSP